MTNALKALGLVLMLMGVGIMAGAIISVLMIFFRQTTPVELFSLPGLEIDLAGMVVGSGTSERMTEVFSSESVNKPLNLFAHLAIMGFLVNAGFSVARLGSGFVGRDAKVE